jgi:2-C-methyl-D-erythritol 4-phosphate cytidylyltransferase/2-C-methyl-D-erythritol 2,4-cyclodiphosphate synthase
MTEKVAAVIVAAGRSTRMAGLDKQFTLAGNKLLLAHTVAVFEASPLVAEYVVVLNEANIMRGRALAYEEGWRKLKKIVIGGARRQDSVWAGLQALSSNPPEWVMVHDGARPFVTPQIIEDGLNAAQEFGASVAAVPVKDTIKLVETATGLVVETPPRDRLWSIQTPQNFQFQSLVKAHETAIAQNLDVTDDAMLLEHLGLPVKVYQASYTNFKITTPDDLVTAQHLFQGAAVKSQSAEISSPYPKPNIRIGQGYDVHRLKAGRPLILGGVHVPFEMGLDGHSDADVLTHVIINALLGAASLGDIGRYFPPTDPIYKDISSLEMLRHVNNLISEKGWQIANIDTTVVAQKPKLAPYIPAMREKLAEVLSIPVALVNVKATTSEEMGFVGRLEGMEAQAIAMLATTV